MLFSVDSYLVVIRVCTMHCPCTCNTGLPSYVKDMETDLFRTIEYIINAI